MGLAYTLAELARCMYRRGQDPEPTLCEAVTWAERSGVPDVVGYVVQAAAEFWDMERVKAWLERMHRGG